ncbi:DNA polymerase, partial [bacterium]|nr:DNA polymerase [bacterium]
MQINKDYTLVTNIGHLQQALNHIQGCDYLSFDVEATGLNVRKDKVIGFGFCGEVGRAFYVPIFKWDNEELTYIGQYEESILTALLEKDLIMHNGSYDIRITKNDLKVCLKKNLVADTILMWHTIQEEGPFGLKVICESIQDQIGYDVTSTALKEKEDMVASIEANGGSSTKTNYELYKADWDKVGYYCCADVDMTLRLFEYCYDILEKDNLLRFFFDEEVMPLYRNVTIKMEEKGVKLDLPYIESNYIELLDKLKYYENTVIAELQKTKHFNNWFRSLLNTKVKMAKTGKFGQKCVEYYALDLPKSKSGKFSMAKAHIEKLDCIDYVKDFLLQKGELPREESFEIQEMVWLDDNDGKHINLSSKPQMKELIFDHFGMKPLSHTDKGNPQFNDTFVDTIEEEWAKPLKIYNRLSKIKSSYFDRFLEGHENGYYFFSYKQHGTISGRYGSDAQQLPRPMEEGEDFEDVIYFSNMVRRFFIADQGRLFVDADYESLEPHVFAHVSGDEGLRDIFRKGHDFYSTIAIATEGLEPGKKGLDVLRSQLKKELRDGVSADKAADNYLGKLAKARRQSAKAYSLGVPYGMGAYALGKTLEITTEEAEVLIDGYLGGFPDLKKWMDRSKYLAQSKGFVTSESGRVRHLSAVKEIYAKHGDKLMNFKYRNKLISSYTRSMGKDEAKRYITGLYKDYKNGINNARNFQIQSLSGSIVNRAAIVVQLEFDKNGIDSWVCAQIHDQLIFNIPANRKEECLEIIQRVM